jgi:hypothetical protein
VIRCAASVLALVLVSGCSDPTAFVSGDVEVRVSPPVLTLMTPSTEPTYYIVVERQALANINIVPCVRPECPNVVRNHRPTRVPFNAIWHYRDEAREAVVLLYRVVADTGGTFRAEGWRSVVVQLE